MMKTCTAKPNGYAATMCEAMKEAGEYFRRSKKSKGLFFQLITNTATLERVGTRVVLYSGENAIDGIVLNICPFCAGKLHDKFECADSQPPNNGE